MASKDPDAPSPRILIADDDELIAEGVESEEQANVLRELGCDLAQGYHLGRPEPAETFQRLYLG